MNLYRMLLERAQAGSPLRVALIGAGKFGSMYLAQVKHTPGTHLTAIADLAPDHARAALARVGWPMEKLAARSADEALRHGTTWITDDAPAMIAADGIEIVIDATGSPAAGIRHVLACCKHGKHVVMVNVEADALAGPLLAARGGRRVPDSTPPRPGRGDGEFRRRRAVAASAPAYLRCTAGR